MTKKDVLKELKKVNIPVAYNHFAESDRVKLPFMVYFFPSASNFAADGSVYYKKDVLHIELYTEKKNIELEEKVESILEENGLFYKKTEIWISEEKMYEILYETEV